MFPQSIYIYIYIMQSLLKSQLSFMYKQQINHKIHGEKTKGLKVPNNLIKKNSKF